MIVYKVVQVKNGRFYSCIPIINILRGQYDWALLEYRVNEKTVPVLKGSMLFAFTHFDMARLFKNRRRSGHSWKIFKAFTYKHELPGFNVKLCEIFEDMKAFWTSGRQGNITIPRGTVFCEDITLLRDVTDSENGL